MDPVARQRFARQLLLAEIGDAGQERLCRTRAQIAADAEPRAAAVARAYLERAGVQVVERDATALAVAVPAAEAVRALAGAPELQPAAAALAGAFAAVEAIKAALAIGSQAALPQGFALRVESRG